MSGARPRVVFDCNVLLQAMAYPFGKSGWCFEVVSAGRAELVVSADTLREVEEVSARWEVASGMRITPRRRSLFLDTLKRHSTLVREVQRSFAGCGDADDDAYIDLALAAGAMLVVSKDHHLLSLMRQDSEPGARLRELYPGFRIVEPSSFLAEFDPTDETGFSRF